jgi:hypothetical protein
MKKTRLHIEGGISEEATRLILGFPLLFSRYHKKLDNLIHHTFFPSPIPLTIGFYPDKVMQFLNALPVLYISPRRWYLNPITNERDGTGRLELRRAKRHRNVKAWRPMRKVLPGQFDPSAYASPAFSRQILEVSGKIEMMPDWAKDPVAARGPAAYADIAKGREANHDTRMTLHLRPSDLRLDNHIPVAPGTLSLSGRCNVLSPTPRHVDNRLKVIDRHHAFWQDNSFLYWQSRGSDPRHPRGERDNKEAVKALIARHFCGAHSPLMAILYPNIRDMGDGGFEAQPEYVGDPMSVLLYSILHGHVPEHIIRSDMRIDQRIWNYRPWEAYEDYRREVTQMVAAHLDPIMDALCREKGEKGE